MNIDVHAYWCKPLTFIEIFADGSVNSSVPTANPESHFPPRHSPTLMSWTPMKPQMSLER